MSKQDEVRWATNERPIGRCLCYLVLGLALCTEDVVASTYYVSPSGSDASAGTVNTPWRTFAYAMSRTVCGDTLVLKDGEYRIALHGSLNIDKSCTASSPFTVQAQNERAAFINGDGSAASLLIANSAYITVNGLRVKSADRTPCKNDYRPVMVKNSNYLILKRLLVHENNRYCNTHLIGLQYSNHVLVEESELYDFHRHGIAINYGGFHVIRRVYCHSRSRADIPGGFPSGTLTQGDSCIAVYPSSDNILENIIAENVLSMAETNASNDASLARRNQYLGNILLGTRRPGTSSFYGFIITARSSTSQGQPRDNTLKNNVIINVGDDVGGGVGIYSRSSYNTRVENATVINARISGYVADKVAATGGGDYSFYCTNCLAIGNNGNGFTITSDIQAWSVNRSHAWNNRANYSPSSSLNYRDQLPATVDPAFGTCYLWVPDGSPMKGAGLNGADIGANILYRYENGVLTREPLWNPSTGEFPHGALVAGLNDVPGQSLFDVNRRLNVNTNGCLFPESYAQGGDASFPRAPHGLLAR